MWTMRDTPTCFITLNVNKTYGPYTVRDALTKVDVFLEHDDVLSAPELVQVWNLGWRQPQPLGFAKPFLLAELRKAKYAC
jgi:hypothetical protein